MLWAQLGNASALADPALTTRCGPSTPVIGEFHCIALTAEDLAALPRKYAHAASILKELGFGVVEINAAHRFILGQFL